MSLRIGWVDMAAGDVHLPALREFLEPCMDFLLDVFGPARLIRGSDWPVLNLAGDYHGWHEASSHWFARLSGDERAGIEGLNAARFYGL